MQEKRTEHIEETSRDELRSVTINVSSQIGHIRSLQGVNDGPISLNGVNVAAQQRQLSVDFVRIHDASYTGAGDIYVGTDSLFHDWGKDPDDPASYNFEPTDRLIKSIVDNGAEVYFRVGCSVPQDTTDPAGFVTPPPDMDKFAAVARHVAQHYNDGWANGFHFNIRYWEVWNEADLQPFWRDGTSAQYHELYAKTAQALKSYDTSLRVGGPAIATHSDLTGLRESFLGFVRDNRLPLDFFSFHHYTVASIDPLDFVRLTNMYRELLDQFGFHQTELHLTEWNFALESPELDPAQLSPMYRAAFVADALIYMQDSPLDRAFFYRGDAGEGSLYLFNADGTFKKVTRAFEAVGTLNETPVRLRASGSDQAGFAVLAGCTHNRHQIRVLIGNYEIPPQVQGPIPGGNTQTIPGIATFTWPDRRSVTYANNRGYNLTIDNLPWGNDEYIIERYRIDDSHDLSLVDTKRHRGSSVELSAALPAPGIELIVLTKC